MEGGMDRQTDHGRAGARRAAGVLAPPHGSSRGGHGEGCRCSGKRPVPSSPPRGNPDLTFRSRQSHQRPALGPAARLHEPPRPGGERAGAPSLPPLSLLLLLPAALPLPSRWARAPCRSRSCPGSLPAAESGGNTVGSQVPRTDGSRQPWERCLMLPSPALASLLLLFLPPQMPNPHSTGEALSILPASPG